MQNSFGIGDFSPEQDEDKAIVPIKIIQSNKKYLHGFYLDKKLRWSLENFLVELNFYPSNLTTGSSSSNKNIGSENGASFAKKLSNEITGEP